MELIRPSRAVLKCKWMELQKTLQQPKDLWALSLWGQSMTKQTQSTGCFARGHGEFYLLDWKYCRMLVLICNLLCVLSLKKTNFKLWLQQKMLTIFSNEWSIIYKLHPIQIFFVKAVIHMWRDRNIYQFKKRSYSPRLKSLIPAAALIPQCHSDTCPTAWLCTKAAINL